MIKLLLISGVVLQNTEPFYIDENEQKVWNIPQDLVEFKKVGIDTINWVTGQAIKKALGNDIQLSTSNSKGIILIAKLLSSSGIDTSSLTELETQSFNKMVSLAESGYADSELLNASLSNVDTYISKATEKIIAITNADSIDAVIDVLNAEL